MKIDLQAVEDTAKALYIRALKVLPPDIKEGFSRLEKRETEGTAQRVLATHPNQGPQKSGDLDEYENPVS